MAIYLSLRVKRESCWRSWTCCYGVQIPVQGRHIFDNHLLLKDIWFQFDCYLYEDRSDKIICFYHTVWCCRMALHDIVCLILHAALHSITHESDIVKILQLTHTHTFMYIYIHTHTHAHTPTLTYTHTTHRAHCVTSLMKLVVQNGSCPQRVFQQIKLYKQSSSIEVAQRWFLSNIIYIAFYVFIMAHSATLHSTDLHSTALHSTALHSIALHSTALHSTAAHCSYPTLMSKIKLIQ